MLPTFDVIKLSVFTVERFVHPSNMLSISIIIEVPKSENSTDSILIQSLNNSLKLICSLLTLLNENTKLLDPEPPFEL